MERTRVRLPSRGVIVDAGVVGRSGELSDTQWERLESLMRRVSGRSRPWRDHRQVVEGIIFRYRTGTPWRDMPNTPQNMDPIFCRFETTKPETTPSPTSEPQARTPRLGPLLPSELDSLPPTKQLARHPSRGLLAWK